LSAWALCEEEATAQIAACWVDDQQNMGNSFQLVGRAWAAALIYRLTGERRALGFAADHVDWLLGKNPLDPCLFEGKGAHNPPRYHHRYNQIPGHERGAVPGTIPNGFVGTWAWPTDPDSI